MLFGLAKQLHDSWDIPSARSVPDISDKSSMAKKIFGTAK
jgi:hypothetical protein